MKSALISGVSTGIGLSLAKQLLAQGYTVFGMSRREVPELIENPNFRFCAIDFFNLESASLTLNDFIKSEKITRLSRLFLNAGQFGKRIAPLSKVSVSDLDEMMRVNVWSHKLVLDCLLAHDVIIQHVIVSSSIAGVRARAGNSGYAITKAALNMVAKLYALENPAIRFLVLGLCNVDTFLSRTIGSLPLEGDFPEIVKLRVRAQMECYMISADQRAGHVLDLFDTAHFDTLANGDFVEIRSLIS